MSINDLWVVWDETNKRIDTIHVLYTFASAKKAERNKTSNGIFVVMGLGSALVETKMQGSREKITELRKQHEDVLTNYHD